MKEKIENAIGLVYTVVEALCRLVLIFMVCTVTAQVISRALGGNIKWCEEVMLILLDTMMFLLLPVGIKDDLHIRIEVFAKYFPRKVKVFLLYFSNAILLVVSLCMIRYGFFLMEKTNSSLSIQSSKNAVFSRLFAYLMFKPYVFSLVFALMSQNKGNFFILHRLLYPSALRNYASLPL